MAFWNINSNFSMVSATEKAMDRENFTLQDLLDTEDILKEVLVPNTRVIEYLCQPQIISELVDYAVAPDLQRPEEPKESEKNEKQPAQPAHPSDSDGAENNEAAIEDANDKVEPQAAIEDHDPSGTYTLDGAHTPDDVFHRLESERSTAPTASYVDHTDYDISEDSLQLSGSSDTEKSDANDQEFEEERLKRVRYAKLSSEILTTDVWKLLDALLSNDEAMHKLWSILDADKAPASTQQLSMFTKIVESLLEKRLDGMLDFIRTLPHFVDYCIRYIECQPLVDFLIKVISTDHPDNPTDIIDLLYDQQLIPKMISLLGPDVSHGVQIAAGDFLKAFVNISGGNKSDVCAIGPNELSRQFVSEECISELIRLMLFGDHGMCVAVTVIIEIIRKNNSDYDLVEVMQTTLESHPPNSRDNIYLGTMVKLFARAIPKFQEMLVAPETRTMQMPFGKVKPLGFERFRICELYAELLHCSNMNLLNDPKGEQMVRERDQRRREASGHYDSAGEHAVNASTLDDTNDEAHSNSGKGAHGDHDSDASRELHTSESESDSGGDEDSPAAYAPRSSPPMSPTETHEELTYREEARSPGGRIGGPTEVEEEVIESPLMSPSPPTPEDDSGEELEYIDGERPKISVSHLRNQELEAKLEDDKAQLLKDPVVGDQLKIALDENGCIAAVLRMLFEFPWNNFLHNVVFDIVQQVFNGHIDHGYNKFLAIHMFTKDHITKRIVEGQRANDKNESERHIRLGYVGHLTLISEEVVKFESLFDAESVCPQIAEALREESWMEYVYNDLLRLREQYNTVLGKVSMVGEEDELYDEQEQERQSIIDMEMEVIQNDRGGSGLHRKLDNSDESDSDSDEDDDDDGEDDDEVIAGGASSSEGEDEDGNDGDEEPALSPQGHYHHHIERISGSDIHMDDDEADLKNGEPNESSEFSRYLSHQLSSDAGAHVETGFSDDDDDSNEAWVPVSNNANTSQ